MTTQHAEQAQNTPDKTPTRKTLVLIDGHAMIHRAFHALPETLTNKSGELVNATFGFTNILLKVLGDVKPNYIAVAFDRPTPTFRHQQFAPYKVHRPTLPDNMRPQFGRIREIVEAFGIPIYEKDGFEADDVIGSLAVQATQQGVNTIILTGDMDTLQLVNEHVKVMAAKQGISEVTTFDEAAVKARYGISPQQLPDFKGLVGDKSDNIPSVPGIGEKTASKLLADYGDLESVLTHIDELKPKEQKFLREAVEQARQSKYLATIVLDAPVQLDLRACRVGNIHRDRVLALFHELEFRSLIEKVLALVREQETGQSQVSASVPLQSDDHLSDLRLIIELVPQPCWYSNMRTKMPRAAWDKLRKQVYAQYHYQCEICQAKDVRLHCHEIWQYDDDLHVQTLRGFIALCEMCHHCKHIGLAGILAAEGKLDFQQVIEHFMHVNQCSPEEYEAHSQQAWDTWTERSRHAWTTDLGDYAHLVTLSR